MTVATHTLARKTFRVSRLAEFASVAELIKTTGHPVSDWPLVIVKELADNALDAAEEAGKAPSIEIVVGDDSITVADQGPGIAPDTVASLVDYSVRTSSRAAYVSPTRGAQGNALQSIIPMGFALASLPSDVEELDRCAGERDRRAERRGDGESIDGGGGRRRARRARRRRRDRKPWRRPPHRLRRRPGAADAGRQPRSGAVRCKNRDKDHGALAEFS